MAKLHRMHIGSVEKPALIFFHGLGGHWTGTWQHADCQPDDCWPHWVGQSTDCDTWSLEYDAALSAWTDQAMALSTQGNQLLDLLDSTAALRGRPLVLIGHSMGGLVIKRLIVNGRTQGEARFNALVQRVRGVVFIATPHAGTPLASLAHALRVVLKTNAQVGNMAAHDGDLALLNQQFKHAASKPELGLAAHVFFEQQGVRVGCRFFGIHFGGSVMVVDRTSADPGLPGVVPVPIAGDHLSLCRPAGRDEQIHQSLCNFLSELPPDACQAEAGATALALDQDLEALYADLLRLPVPDHTDATPDQAVRRTAAPDLLQAARQARLPDAAMVPGSPGLVQAIKASLLRRYAYWASGGYQPFGGAGDGRGALEPVLLASHFHPIAIWPDQRAGEGGDRDGRAKDAKRQPRDTRPKNADGLDDLFDKNPDVHSWVLMAPPAGGKTTLLAAFELAQAHAALRRYNDSGQFGCVVLWLPMRKYESAGVRDLGSAMAALWALARTRYHLWAPALCQAAQLGELQPLRELGLRFVWLLDGANEMPADGQDAREQALDWIEAGLAQLRDQAPDLWGPRVVTVRTHSRRGMLQDARTARLQPWDDARRCGYMALRLGPDSTWLAPLQQAIDADSAADTGKLMATPGHLAVQVTLLQSGVVKTPSVSRAELFCTLLWVRLHQEVIGKRQIPKDLLSHAERGQIEQLADGMQRSGGWRWPVQDQDPRMLIGALARLAVSQQHLDPYARQRQQSAGAAERVWAMQTGEADFRNPPHLPPVPLEATRSRALLQAAAHLNVLVPDAEAGVAALAWSHQLWLELFAALGLSPDQQQAVWLSTPPPELQDMDSWWKQHLLVEQAARQQGQKLPEFRLPQVPESSDTETLRYLAQLRGSQQVVAIVERVMSGPQANPELAARLALDNWDAFDERRNHPQDAWRSEGKLLANGRVDPESGGTHWLLNQLRAKLLAKMSSPTVHIALRIQSGNLLGELGGDGRFQICGDALILKDEFWQEISARPVLMGDLEGRDEEKTESGGLLLAVVGDFRMGGLLVTVAQLRCFVESQNFLNDQWWPHDRYTKGYTSIKPSKLSMLKSSCGTHPASVQFWVARAYSLWENQQRRSAGYRDCETWEIRLPRDVEWEAGARHLNPNAEQWSLPHSGARWSVATRSFGDQPIWRFNCADITGGSTSPVGVFCESRAGCLDDVIGNDFEWTSSEWTDHLLLHHVLTDATGFDDRSKRGGRSAGEDCRVSQREPGIVFFDAGGDVRLGLPAAVRLIQRRVVSDRTNPSLSESRASM